ncbi:NAD(P)-binding protein [Setomelanomma holmii]|uniref:NAD(P)-binding protein n=1 Tax=Setomelanomma holmii TaxID=210430 RepID=A0A9P4H0M3_9PLEO|nr:NAD(P)-binding protein [Setomelanomma holmii]
MISAKGRVLLSGANGFVASHIVEGLIAQNYHNVGTVRSKKKAQDIFALHPDWTPHITWAYIADIGASSAFDETFEEVGHFDYVNHNASPVDFTVSDFKRDMIDPAMRGCEAAPKLGGPGLKRIVFSGSTASISDFFHSDAKAREQPWNEDDWNTVTADYAVQNNNVFAAAPSFDITVLNPYVIMGPMLHLVKGTEDIPSTVAFPIWNFLNGTYAQIEDLLFPAWNFVDVRYVARPHILYLTTASASNKRIALVSWLSTPQLVINAIRKNFPDLRERVIKGEPEQLVPDGVEPTNWDTSWSFEVFGQDWAYKSLEETVVDTVRDLIAREKEWSA